MQKQIMYNIECTWILIVIESPVFESIKTS